ncbi:MAG: MBL fold metallo-hydrolase [Gammaproteobacteria bacterium]|nr:MBL fold metallo-hydrolase [Gammaproteobacteria bacterium]
MRFAYLGSGSRGNCAVIESGSTRLMLDCGFSIKETARRLQRLGLDPDDITAILVTHEHSDHISGVGGFARKYGTPVWMTPGTHATNKTGVLPDVQTVHCQAGFAIGDITVQPVAVPHDAKEPCQYVFNANGLRLGVLTDVGHITPHIEEHYRYCDALVVECNHDRAMLQSGPYPWSLKQRVGGDYGHLNNQQAASLVARVDHNRLRLLMGVHISEKNNTADLAHTALQEAVPAADTTIHIADQQQGAPWCDMRLKVDA